MIRVKRSKINNGRNSVENRMVKSLDELAAWEEFKAEILPMLRKDMTTLSVAEMRDKYMRLLTARQISIALAEKDSSKALAAIKDIQDRAEGKSVEKKDGSRKYDRMTDDELDAMLLSEMKSVGFDDDSDDPSKH